MNRLSVVLNGTRVIRYSRLFQTGSPGIGTVSNHKNRRLRSGSWMPIWRNDFCTLAVSPILCSLIFNNSLTILLLIFGPFSKNSLRDAAPWPFDEGFKMLVLSEFQNGCKASHMLASEQPIQYLHVRADFLENVPTAWNRSFKRPAKLSADRY